MITKKKIRIILTLPLLYILTGCLYKGDCTHNFEYHGKIKASNNTLKDSLIIRFDNLGDIIFKTPNKENRERSTIDNKGHYKVKGDFFTACVHLTKIFLTKLIAFHLK